MVAQDARRVDQVSNENKNSLFLRNAQVGIH